MNRCNFENKFINFNRIFFKHFRWSDVSVCYIFISLNQFLIYTRYIYIIFLFVIHFLLCFNFCCCCHKNSLIAWINPFIFFLCFSIWFFHRRKKKCIRYMEGDNDERTNDGDDMRGGNISDDNLGSCGSVDDVKTPPEDDEIESLNHSLSSPGAFSGLSYLQSPSTNLASPLRTNSILYNSNNLSQTHTENSHSIVNDSNNNSNPNNSTNSHNINSIIKWYWA